MLLAPLLAALKSSVPDEVRSAAAAVFSTYAGRDTDSVGHTVHELLPHRESLDIVLRDLLTRLANNRSHLLPTVNAVLRSLARDPLTITHHAGLAAAALRGNVLVAYLESLAPELHAEALMAIVKAVEPNLQAFAAILPWAPTSFGEWEIDDIGQRPQYSRAECDHYATVEAAFASRADDRLRRIALATLIAQSNQATGWTDDLRARLDHYRRDPSPLVAAAAAFTFPPKKP